MAKLFVLLLVCLIAIKSVLALECYNCFTNANDKNCDEFSDKNKMRVSTCGRTTTNYKSACLKKVIQDSSTSTVNTTRSCVLLKPDGATDVECKAPSERYTVISCDVCMDDLCNAAPANSVAYVGGLVLVSTIIAKILV